MEISATNTEISMPGVDAVVTDPIDEVVNDHAAFQWTIGTISQSILLFVAAGVAEILGGWMVWMAVRGNDKDEKKPWWFAMLGSMVLVLYGIIPCFQPTSNFGRIYAVYGGFFIVLSYFFGWLLDGVRPDVGDMTGGSIAIVGVCIAYFWPRL